MGGITFRNTMLLYNLEGEYVCTIFINFLRFWWCGLVCKEFEVIGSSSRYSKFEACMVAATSVHNSIQACRVRIDLFKVPMVAQGVMFF